MSSRVTWLISTLFSDQLECRIPNWHFPLRPRSFCIYCHLLFLLSLFIKSHLPRHLVSIYIFFYSLSLSLSPHFFIVTITLFFFYFSLLLFRVSITSFLPLLIVLLSWPLYFPVYYHSSASVIPRSCPFQVPFTPTCSLCLSELFFLFSILFPFLRL